MDEFAGRSAGELARAVRARRTSAAELVEAALARIERVNPVLNAVVCTCEERAREEALARDAALARGELMGLLHGVPITLKDSIDTTGVVTTGGTVGRRAFVPAEDATVAARLRAAGAILLGKTNTPELTLSFETDNAVYGRTANPWDPARSPGGSSGGSAAIVAAGAVPFDVGSDTGGSIRVPAHFCGIAGLRPTSGRVPRTGHVVPFGGLVDSLTTLGPLARSVDDLELTLRVISGPDGRDPAIVPAPLRSSRAVVPASLRVAVYGDNGVAAPTLETRTAVERAAKLLAEAGARVEQARPPGIEETRALFFEVIGLDGGYAFRRLLDAAGTAEADQRVAPMLAGLASQPSDPGRTGRTIERWDRFRMLFAGFLRDYDAILCPVNATPAKLQGGADPALDDYTYTMTYNLVGLPVLVVRAGTSPEDLPIGVQIAARPFREDVALALGRALQQALGPFPGPPL